MVFSSVIFIFCFLPIVLIGYYLLPIKVRNIWLLSVSFVFYSWNEPKYLILLIVSILCNYVVGLVIGQLSVGSSKRKFAMWAGVLLNVSILIYYKYFDFLLESANQLFGTGLELRYIVLPVGISFFTFQGMSYIIDVYRKEAPAAKNPLDVALYIALFSQLVAGPILKYADIQGQIVKRKETIAGFEYGIERFSYGLAKKVLISNVLGELVDRIWQAQPAYGMDTITAWIGALAYAMQIYFDFSGYSDMAIGLGAFFGFHFKENFNYPYIAQSISDFWRRWHISLSTWFREYVYIPLGGNRKGNVYCNLFIVFLVTGIWHGANITFFIWGIWYGIFIVLERLIRAKKWYINVPIIIKWFVTMFIVLIGWVVFRAPGLGEALDYLKIMFGIEQSAYVNFTYRYYLDFKIVITLLLAVIGSTPLVKTLLEKTKEKLVGQLIKIVVQGILLIYSVIAIVSGSYNPFIYFQF